MIAIAAVDRNWGIGNKGKLLVSIPDDMKYFKEMTTGNIVVMGRKTFESFPAGPLKNRVNIILTQKQDYEADGALIVHSTAELSEALDRLYDNPENAEKYTFVIGGESIYRLLLDKCSAAFITVIDKSFEADAHFPNLNEHPDFTLAETSPKYVWNDIAYAFTMFKRKEKL